MTPVILIRRQLATLNAFFNLREPQSTLFKHLTLFLKEYGTVVIGVGATRLLTLIASVILARKLDVEDFGAFSVAYTVAMLIGQLPGVLDTSFVRHSAISSLETEQRALLRAHLYIKLVALGVLTVAAFGASDILATYVFKKAGLGLLLLLAILSGGFFSLFTTGLAFYQCRGQFFRYAGLYFAESLVGLLAVVTYTSFFQPSALGSIGVYALVFGIFGIIVCSYLYVQSRPLPAVSSLKSQWQRLLRFSSWLIPANLCYTLLERIDMLLLAGFADYFSLGLYGAAVRVVAIFSLFTGNLSVIFLPKAAEAVQSPRALKTYLAQSSLAILGILALITAGIVWAPILISVTLGPNYIGTTELLRVLLVGSAFIALSSPLSCLIYAIGRTSVIFAQRLMELGTALVMAFLLMPHFAALGAALSLVAAYFIGCSFVILNTYRLVLRRIGQTDDTRSWS